jgi:DNA-binding winged helix-turn-helix (wHTH) protein
MSKHGQRIYEFGPFRLDTDSYALLRDGRPVTLTRKAVEMLIVLIEHRGEVLEKESLLRRLWPDTTVEDSNLTQNIYMIRQALGEGAQQQTYIETVPKRGYRFVAEVTEVSPNGHGAPTARAEVASAAAGPTHARPETHTRPRTRTRQPGRASPAGTRPTRPRLRTHQRTTRTKSRSCRRAARGRRPPRSRRRSLGPRLRGRCRAASASTRPCPPPSPWR